MVKSQDNAIVNSRSHTVWNSELYFESFGPYNHLLLYSLSFLTIMARRLAFALAVAATFSNADARFATQGSSNVAVYWGELAATNLRHI